MIVGGQCDCGPEFCLAVEWLHDFAKVVIQIAPQESAFRLAELLARVRAQVRRASGEATEDELSVGEIRVDVAAHRAFVGSRELQLTTREFELLRVLVRAGGKVANRAFLIDAEGRVARAWRKVKVPGHAEEVLEAAKAL